MTGYAEALLVQPDPPSNPNLVDGQIGVTLAAISLWPVDTIRSVLVFPAEIVLDRFLQAVSRAAAVVPTVAGRYVRRVETDGTKFFIDLTCSPIPLSLRNLKADQPFPSKDVIQPTIEPYIAPLQSDYFRPGANSSLLALQLTTLLPSRRSVLGVTWAHILGDAGACNMFMQILSTIYSGEEVPTSLLPTFGPHINMPVYPVDRETSEKYRIRQITPTYSIPESRKEFAAMTARSEPVKMSLSRQELQRMVDECQDGRQVKQRLSTQDILSAWWVNMLQRAGVQYRTLHRDSPYFPSSLPTLAGNVAQMLAIPVPSPLVARSSIADQPQLDRTLVLAQSIRSSLDELRQDVNIAIEWLSAIAQWLEEAAREERTQVVRAYDGEVVVNSNLRFNWIIPFGFPWDETQYHTSFSSLHVLRVYEANPLKGQGLGETNVELVFNVLADGKMRKKVEGILLNEKQRWRQA